jgi:hypothetical protein
MKEPITQGISGLKLLKTSARKESIHVEKGPRLIRSVFVGELKYEN